MVEILYDFVAVKHVDAIMRTVGVKNEDEDSMKMWKSIS